MPIEKSKSDIKNPLLSKPKYIGRLIFKDMCKYFLYTNQY